MTDHREFLKTAALAGAGVSLAAFRPGAVAAGNSFATSDASSAGLYAAPPLECVRIGFVGVGHQGSSHVQNFLGTDNVDIVAICDITPANLVRSGKAVTDKGHPAPKTYGDTLGRVLRARRPVRWLVVVTRQEVQGL